MGALSLIGGLFGQQNQNEINQQNIAQAQYMAQNAIQMRVADAKAAGINPLAALGSSFQPSPPQLVGSSALPDAMNNAGQDIGRAATAYQDSQDKLVALNARLLQSQINKTDAETTTEMMRNSQIARTFAAPGSPPPFPPLPRAAPGYAATLPPAMVDYRGPNGEVITAPSDKFSQATMSPASAALWPHTNTDIVSGEIGNLYRWARPDVVRTIQNLPGSYNPEVYYGFP